MLKTTPITFATAAALAAASPTIASIDPVLTILPPSPVAPGGFGLCDIANNRVLVGNPAFVSPLGNRGALYVFDATTGDLLAEFADVDQHPEFDFGAQFFLAGDTAANVISERESIARRDVFTFNVATNTQGPILNPRRPLDAGGGNTGFAFFGNTAQDQGLLAVGAHRAYESTDNFVTETNGAIHIFDLNTLEASRTITLDPVPVFDDRRDFAEVVDVQDGRVISTYFPDRGPLRFVIFDAATGDLIDEFDALPELTREFPTITPLLGTSIIAAIARTIEVPCGPCIIDINSRGLRGLVGRDGEPIIGGVALEDDVLAVIEGDFLSADPPTVHLFETDNAIHFASFEVESRGAPTLWSLAIDNHTLAVGGTTSSVDTSSGAVYVYDISQLPRPCSPADQAPPFGELNPEDTQAFIDSFLNFLTPGDLAPPFGIRDLTDVDTFITAFLAGCL